MKNIFVEGIPGMGKSTLVQKLYTKLPGFHVCREGDYSPVELAWCTWMTQQQYEQALECYAPIRDEIIRNTVKEGEYYIITYTRIITDIPNFHRDLEEFEIYNGRRNFAEFEEIVTSRHWNFKGTGHLFECSFFQNIMEELILFQQFGDEEIVEFYRKLYGGMNQEAFLLIYLYSDKVEECIRAIKEERVDNQGYEMWYSLMLKYLIHSPYGERHGCKDFEDLVAHFRHRQQLELRIIREVIGERGVVLPAKEWEMEEIISLLG